MAWVYILSTESGKYYIGSTENIDARLKHHKGGFTPSTKALIFKDCVLKQEYKNLRQAREVERRLKKLKRRDYIEKIIKEGYIKAQPTLR